MNRAEEAARANPAEGPGDATLRQATARAVAGIGEDVDKFHFNAAVARIRTLTNALEESLDTTGGLAIAETTRTLVKLVNPIMPHLAEELWQRLGHDTLLTDEPWPTYDPALLVSDTVTMAVQVNGKLRATISLPRDADQATAQAAALADENVAKFLGGQPPRKVVVVPNRIVNIVA